MGTTDRLEMTVDLDDAGARKQVAALERRGINAPLNVAPGAVGGKPGGVRGIRGVPGMGRLSAGARFMTGGYGAAGLILGGGMMASQIISEMQRPGGMSMGRIIASGAGALGSAMLMGAGLTGPAAPYVAAIGALLSVGSMLWQNWKSSKSKDLLTDFDLGAIRDRFKRDVEMPPTEIRKSPGIFEAASSLAPMPGGDPMAQMQTAQANEDVLGELRGIRQLLGRVVLQGNA
jgi:hypothetical protein